MSLSSATRGVFFDIILVCAERKPQPSYPHDHISFSRLSGRSLLLLLLRGGGVV
jgi:hypothetical protein